MFEDLPLLDGCTIFSDIIHPQILQGLPMGSLEVVWKLQGSNPVHDIKACMNGSASGSNCWVHSK